MASYDQRGNAVLVGGVGRHPLVQKQLDRRELSGAACLNERVLQLLRRRLVTEQERHDVAVSLLRRQCGGAAAVLFDGYVGVLGQQPL
jgi:hypothetical protein